MLLFRILRNIRKHRDVFGSIRGIIIYFKIKLNRTNKIVIPGIRYPFSLRSASSDIAIFYQVFFNKEYAIDLKFEPKFIIDAGANIGLSAIYFSNRFPDAQIISIEPEDENFTLLEKNTLPYTKVVRKKAALSNLNDEELFVDSVGLGHSGFVTTNTPSSQAKNKVKTISVDQVMSESGFDIIDILKIDIEGHEKEVFEKGTDLWLPKTKCLVIELHDHMKKGCSTSLFNAIIKYNFSLDIKGENLVFINNDLVL